MNRFGNKFRISIFGESHGPQIGIVVDGVPGGIPLSPDDFTEDMSRRRSGASGTTPRKEADVVTIVSGVFNGHTTGSPICMTFMNNNTRPSDYEKFESHPRPGHADFTATRRHNGYADLRGGGHHSGRVTIGLVAAGVIAKKIIEPVSVVAKISEIGGFNPWDDALAKAAEAGDSLGGIIECRASEMPVGIGEPFFDSLESVISHIVFAIPGIRGIEFGDGFAASKMKGSQHNDPIADETGKTLKNGSGGINGGISNGNELLFRVAVKPTSSISVPQHTFNFYSGEVEELRAEGRHDTCFALRVPVIVEAAVSIALADLLM
ncbi:MAG: chorismate synthase [Bacteroidetes bacterium HGW-Bacteroidetes-10]|nr:MAG: chorismate synthase [Bacteroidetes bacterium HGW-Bacteroidetes-10]